MRQLIIVLDSSVSLKKGEEVGPAVCFWLAYVYDPSQDNHPVTKKLEQSVRYESAILMEAARKKPSRSGAIYNNIDGPTKIFYDGIVRALESCFYLISKESISEVRILGDCEHAINQLNDRVKVEKMRPMYNQVKKWEKDYKNKKIKVVYEYISEGSFSLYKKLDGICKEIRGRIQNEF